MGYNSKLFSTILKSAGAMSFKERWHARKAINALRKADDIIFKKFPDEVTREHKVTKALVDEAYAFERLRKASEAIINLLFEAEVVEDELIKAVADIRDALKEKNMLEMEKPLFLKIVAALKAADDEERSAYKDVMAIIVESKKGENVLRAAITQGMKKIQKQTALAKWAARGEIKTTLKDLKIIKDVAIKIKRLKGHQVGMKQKIEELLIPVSSLAHDGFHESFSIKKRGIYWMINILYNLYFLRDIGFKYVQMHFLPEAPQKEQKEKIDRVVAKINKDFLIIAQGYRRIISHIEDAEKS